MQEESPYAGLDDFRVRVCGRTSTREQTGNPSNPELLTLRVSSQVGPSSEPRSVSACESA